jgi:hypothetical protein
MDSKPRTEQEQRFWDEVFIDRFPACLKELNKRGLEGCAQWAADQANVALNQRRISEQQS